MWVEVDKVSVRMVGDKGSLWVTANGGYVRLAESGVHAMWVVDGLIVG